jgi:hypothetical protein
VTSLKFGVEAADTVAEVMLRGIAGEQQQAKRRRSGHGAKR